LCQHRRWLPRRGMLRSSHGGTVLRRGYWKPTVVREVRIVVTSSEGHRLSALCRLSQQLNMTLFYARRRYDKGGCPCPSGEVKCGESEYSSGYCTTLCCDWKTQATCYDGYTPISCRSYDDAPCPDHIANSDGQQVKWNEPAVIN
jgi:hypothetical protein